MALDNFSQRKKSVLSKSDKSFIGKWDEKIVGLCNKINELENYYTTSSCSGRIVIMLDKDKKQKDLFLKVYHDLINFKELKKNLQEILNFYKNESIKFKQEPPILHIACKRINDSKKLLRKAQLAGWKKSGIISSGKRIILELNSTEKLEFPIINNRKILVNDCFLKILVKKANKNFERFWKKIRKLENLIK